MGLAQQSAPQVWQPPGRYPQGAVAFLKALVASDSDAAEALAAPLAAGAEAELWVSFLRGHGLAAFAYHRLKRAGALGAVDAQILSALRGAYYSAVADAELHRRELQAALTALAGAGVTVVPFKGAVLAHLAYPDPACRPMGDLDLWATAEAMPRAQAVLEALGYRQHVKDTRPVEFQAQNGGEVQLGGAGDGRGLVELHYSTFAGEWVRLTTTIAGDCIACRTVPVTVAGCPAWALGAEDAVLQLVVHLAVNHQMSYPGVRGLLDILLQARSQPPDWDLVAARARGWRVATAAWLVLSLTHALLGFADAAACSEVLRPAAWRRWLLRCFVNERSMLAGRDLTHGPLRFLFQLFLIDRPRDAGPLIARTLWPDDRWLTLRYGRSSLSVRLRHLTGALRGQP